MEAEDAESLVLLCRPGFEAECAAELRAREPGIACELPAGGGLVVATGSRFLGEGAFRERVFARDAFRGRAFRYDDTRDRIAPLLAAARAFAPVGALWLQHVDTQEGRSLGRLCTRLEARFAGALREAGVLRATGGRRLHVLFLSGAHGWIGVSEAGDGACWSMGIPRLRLPGAPSRSAAKLEEAVLWFLGDDADRLLRAGMRAVDLGAAPGGWTWVLARRGLDVTAVDHGALRREALEAGRVRHLRADAFTWRPPRPVDWLVCDIVDKPARVAELVERWFLEGRCRRALVNLKLPMKQRQREVATMLGRLRGRLAGVLGGLHCEARQLYHDREEITVFLAPGTDA